MLKQRREKQQEMELVIMEQMIPEDHLLRKVDRAVDFSFIYELCAPLYCADNGRPAIDPEVLFRMLLVGYLYGVKSEARLEEEVNYNIAYKWFCGLGLTEKAPDATTISQNRRRRFRDNNIAEQIFNEILRQCIAKGLVGGAILYTDSTHIKAKANKHKKKLVSVEQTPKAYMEELDAQVDQDRKVLGKKPFDRDDEDHMGGGMTKRMHSTSDPESGQQSREGKPDGFHYSEHRTVDSKRNVIVNVHIEPANLNDVTPLPEILDEIQARLGKLPKYMGLDAGYHNTWIAHLLEKKGIQGVIGYRRHTHKTPTYGKYRFKYDSYFDAYICPEHKHLYWKTTTREGYRQYFCDSKTCKVCPRRTECFGASMTRRMVERHVWQDALDDVIAFTKSEQGRRIYSWRKETIERSFAEAKVNHGLRYARMLGIRNMREQSFLTAAVQNIKRLVASSFSLLLRLIARLPLLETGFVSGLTGEETPPPLPPLPVSAKILRIFGRGNCKETIFALENGIFLRKNRPVPAVHAVISGIFCGAHEARALCAKQREVSPMSKGVLLSSEAAKRLKPRGHRAKRSPQRRNTGPPKTARCEDAGRPLRIVDSLLPRPPACQN